MLKKSPAEAKAAFIAAFNDIIADIEVNDETVANAAMTEENITVTFKTSDATEILAGAGVVFEALQDLAEADSSIEINGQTFNLDEDLSISALAQCNIGRRWSRRLLNKQNINSYLHSKCSCRRWFL
jgi:hypothetical protein